MTEITIDDLRNLTSMIILTVESSKEPVTITHEGRPVARIVPVGEESAGKGAADEMAAFGSMVGQMAEMFKGFSVEANIKTTTPDGKTRTQQQKSGPDSSK